MFYQIRAKMRDLNFTINLLYSNCNNTKLWRLPLSCAECVLNASRWLFPWYIYDSQWAAFCKRFEFVCNGRRGNYLRLTDTVMNCFNVNVPVHNTSSYKQLQSREVVKRRKEGHSIRVPWNYLTEVWQEVCPNCATSIPYCCLSLQLMVEGSRCAVSSASSQRLNGYRGLRSIHHLSRTNEKLEH